MFSGKKFLLLGFIVVLLVAIPLTIFLAQQQQQTRSGATASTTLTLTPPTSTKAVGDDVAIAFNVNPGTNQVSTVRFKINYDPTKLATAEAGFEVESWTTSDGTNFTPSLLQPPVYENGSITGVITVGATPQNAITTPTQVATINFKAIAPTETAATSITFDVPNTQVLSVGGESSASENVLSTTSPATVTITGEAPTSTPTETPTSTPTPTTTPTETPTSTPTPTTTQATNQSPVCETLSVSDATDSAAPVTVNLIADGTDQDGTITKVTFNFGDGTTQDVTEGGAIGTNSVNVAVDHIYNSGGTFTASAILTDNSGGQSSSSTCTQTIAIQGTAATATVTPTPITVITAAPTLPPAGPGQTVLFIGAAGAILSAIGVFLLLAL